MHHEKPTHTQHVPESVRVVSPAELKPAAPPKRAEHKPAPPRGGEHQPKRS